MSMGMVSSAQRSPFRYGMAPDWRQYSFDWQAGRSAVFVLALGLAMDALLPLLAALAASQQAFRQRGADLLVLASGDLVPALRAAMPASWGVEVVDCGRPFLESCELPPGEARVVVTDRNIRVALQWSPTEPGGVADRCLACLDSLPQEASQDSCLPAPVLMLPNLLPRELCRELIDRFEAGSSIEGKVASMDGAGRAQCAVDQRVKRRRDVRIEQADPLFGTLQSTLLQRCVPEIEKAFQTVVSHTDRLLIARYEAPEGWFRRHRDNTSSSTAFREFAISINLNTEEYEGGYLTFPEYNDHRYRPGSGGGVVFSSSILHEAAPVTRGRRYALLTFFHGKAAEARRLAYEAARMQEAAPVVGS